MLPRAPHTCDLAVRAKLAVWLKKHPTLHTVSAFTPMPDEIDLIPLLANFPDRRWVFPRIEGDHLALHMVHDPGVELLPGRWGILEPPRDAPEVRPTEVDVFLCPGLAFDRTGGRLGRGRGYYDRLLSLARPDAQKLGICRGAQIVDDTFPEPHDIAMNEVIHS
jgi:5-formyltetrahydrofolate cyclo-ligase